MAARLSKITGPQRQGVRSFNTTSTTTTHHHSTLHLPPVHNLHVTTFNPSIPCSLPCLIYSQLTLCRSDGTTLPSQAAAQSPTWPGFIFFLGESRGFGRAKQTLSLRWFSHSRQQQQQQQQQQQPGAAFRLPLHPGRHNTPRYQWFLPLRSFG
ncbi:hypothetical protein E2C01_017555 [Portunus trituberculatus]|uniref:Uncharacterized protein n=1 Tax=Portunus trituberculatus TaxID=210409 RepID=A0A5B7DTU0_PORTR|nr:hypothetical protein [Portunus trituberculatus]